MARPRGGVRYGLTVVSGTRRNPWTYRSCYPPPVLRPGLWISDGSGPAARTIGGQAGGEGVKHVDLVELRARVRAAARDPETFGRRVGLPPEVVRQMIAGQIRPSPEVAARILRALVTEPEGGGGP